MKIPPINLSRVNQPFTKNILRRFEKILEDNAFILGPEVKELESRFRSEYEIPHAIGVNSGTDALLLALKSLGIGAGDEVITSAFTFIATADVIVRLGAKPVFADIDKDTFNINTEQIEEKINSKTRAIIPVHLYGLPCNMTRIMEIAKKHNLAVIEDCAQAQGATWKAHPVGTIGDFGAFSFYPTKNLGGLGDGGMILTRHDTLADHIIKMRDHGRSEGYSFPLIGYNSRLSSFQAAGLNEKMNCFSDMIKERQSIASSYYKELEKIPEVTCPVIPPHATHTYNQFTIKTSHRDELRAYLGEKGIGSVIYYPSPLHLQPCFAYLKYKEGDFPVSEQVCKEILSLPIFIGLGESELYYIIDTIVDFFHQA